MSIAIISKKTPVDLPRQKVSRGAKNTKWVRQTIDANISMSSFHPTKSISEYDLLDKTYKFYNGEIDDIDYTHVLKPYGKTRANFPAKLHNYPIIKPTIDLLTGEFAKRPFNYSVVVSNPDVVTTKEEERTRVIHQNLQQHFINQLNDLGVNTGVPSEEVPLPDQIAEIFERSYKDQRAIMGQNALQYLTRNLDLIRKFRKAFFHFLVSGRVVTEKGIKGGEPFFEVGNPMEFDYDKSPDTEFIEDGQWALRRKLCNRADVIDAYYDELSPSQVDQLEDPTKDRTGGGIWWSHGYDDERINETKSDLIEVISVYWKSLKRIGIVTYIDEDGFPDEFVVEDGYTTHEDETIEWFWVNEVWQGTRIDGDIYVRTGPVEVQRSSLDNLSKCKLPINGRKYSDINSGNISLVMLGIPYQITYNVYMYRLEVAIAKAKGLIAQLDINMIPSNMSIDKWLYYLDALNIAWTDYNKEGYRGNPQHQASIDLSFREIDQYINLLEFTIGSWERLSGVTRQRQGMTSEYDAVGVTKQSIIQSSNITEDIFEKFNEQKERDLQGILDHSKPAWINGKKTMYVMPDGTIDFLNIDGVEYAESEYGVFVSTSVKDRQNIDALKQLGQPMLQNGYPLSSIAELFEHDNFVILKEKIKQTEENAQKIREQQQQIELEAQQAQVEAQREIELTKMQNDNEQKERDRQNDLQIAFIQAETTMQNELDDDEVRIKEEKIKSDERISNKKIKSDEKMHKEDIKVKMKELGVKARQNASRNTS